jgi:short-subunit dehydrogenase
VPSTELKIIVADLVEEGKKDTIAEVLSEINSLKKGISIVVNNAGVDALAPFTDL